MARCGASSHCTFIELHQEPTQLTNPLPMIATIATVTLAASAAANPVMTQGRELYGLWQARKANRKL